jgi:hypothetical protein
VSIALAPDAELAGVTYLRGALSGRNEPYALGVTVSTKLPPGTSPGRHIRLRRVGGVPYSLVQDSPRLDAQVWYATGAATDEQSRNNLALLVWALLHDIRGKVVALSDHTVTCYRVLDFAGPHAMPDPADDTKTITALTVEIGMRIRAA